MAVSFPIALPANDNDPPISSFTLEDGRERPASGLDRPGGYGFTARPEPPLEHGACIWHGGPSVEWLIRQAAALNACNDNDEVSGKAAKQEPLLTRARGGAFGFGAEAAIDWFETVYDLAHRDPDTIPGPSYAIPDVEYSDAALAPHGWTLDATASYGPSVEDLAASCGTVARTYRGRRVLATIDERGVERWLVEKHDRALGQRRPKNKNGPEPWAGKVHPSGARGAPKRPLPTALITVQAQRELDALRSRVGEESYTVLAACIVYSRTAKDLGRAVGLTHKRAEKRGGELMTEAMRGLMRFYYRNEVRAA